MWSEASITEEKTAVQDLLQKLQSRLSSSPESPQQVDGCQSQWPENFRAWSNGRFSPTPGGMFRSLLSLLRNIEVLRPPTYTPVTPLLFNQF